MSDERETFCNIEEIDIESSALDIRVLALLFSD